MEFDRNTLKTVGEALFGNNWQQPLGREIGVSERTIRRWLTDDASDAIPVGVWRDIADLCDRRGHSLQEWAQRLRS